MAFDGLCFDLMEAVGELVETKRRESCTTFWTHNGSIWRLVNNEFNNTVEALARRGKSITPSRCAFRTAYKYVKKSWEWQHKPNSDCRLPTPQWGAVPLGGCAYIVGGCSFSVILWGPWWMGKDGGTYGNLSTYIERLALDTPGDSLVYPTWATARKRAMLYDRHTRLNPPPTCNLSLFYGHPR
jgi:hypothetical protein